MLISDGDAVVQMAQEKRLREQRRKDAEQAARWGRTIQAVADAARPDDPEVPPEYEVLVKELSRQVGDLYRQFLEVDAGLHVRRNKAIRQQSVRDNRKALADAEGLRDATDETLADAKRRIRAMEDRRDEAGRLAVEDTAAYQRAKGQVSPAEEKRLLSDMKSSILVAQEAEKALNAALPELEEIREALEDHDAAVREARAALDRAEAYAKTPLPPAEPSMLTISLFALDMQADPDIWEGLSESRKKMVSRYLRPKADFLSPQMEAFAREHGFLK